MTILFLKSAAILLFAASLTFAMQVRQFTRADIDYVLELPSPAWQVISRVDVHDHVEFVNGNDPANGYLRLRKVLLDRPATESDLFRLDERWELQHLPGYVVCGECEGIAFQGRLKGAVYSYEYVNGGKTMSGRIYYLQVNPRTFYVLRFTVVRDQLPALREQMDLMAQSFHLKHTSFVARSIGHARSHQKTRSFDRC